MRKINSKEVRKIIKDYIIDRFDIDCIWWIDKEEKEKKHTFEEVANYIAKCFYGAKIERLDRQNRSYNIQEEFYDWLQGLPSEFNSAHYYYNNKAVDVLGDILEQTKEERNNYNEQEAENQMSYMIFKELKSAIFAFCSKF